MRYAVCPRCWMRIRDPENPEEAKDNCPRCLGRLGMQVPLYRTAGPSRRVKHFDESPPPSTDAPVEPHARGSTRRSPPARQATPTLPAS
jgi:hypothetical protein